MRQFRSKMPKGTLSRPLQSATHDSKLSDDPWSAVITACIAKLAALRSFASSYALDAELSEMMIDVLVHENGPLLRFESAEERVGVTGAARGSLTCKAVDCW